MLEPFYATDYGKIYCSDAKELLQTIPDQSVNLVLTSPPFALLRKKTYGNPDADSYVAWFKPFAAEFKRILQANGSLVIDIGGAWNKGTPTKSIYQYELLICLVREFGFHLAQEFFWWNPAKLPTPAEWVNVRRIRVKDAVNCIWWLSPSPWPKAGNKRILQPYSASMLALLKDGYKTRLRPSGHDISDKFAKNNQAAIPPNLIALAHTESNSAYIRYCKKISVAPHPARFPVELPEFFIRFLTDKDDLVIDPFAGSCTSGEACERLERRWICCDMEKSYLTGAVGRFIDGVKQRPTGEEFYRAYRPGIVDGQQGPLVSL